MLHIICRISRMVQVDENPNFSPTLFHWMYLLCINNNILSQNFWTRFYDLEKELLDQKLWNDKLSPFMHILTPVKTSLTMSFDQFLLEIYFHLQKSTEKIAMEPFSSRQNFWYRPINTFWEQWMYRWQYYYCLYPVVLKLLMRTKCHSIL